MVANDLTTMSFLPEWIRQILWDQGVRSWRQIDDMTDADLLAIRGIGPACVSEIRRVRRSWKR